MERINQYSFYEIGKAMKDISSMTGDVAAQSAFSAVYQAQLTIHDILRGNPVPLSISKQCALQLQESISRIWDRFFQGPDAEGKIGFRYPDANEVIPAWMWANLRSALEHFETVLVDRI